MYYLHLVTGRNGRNGHTVRLYGVIMRGVRRSVIPNTIMVHGPFITPERAMVRASAQHATVIGG